jgi:CheY-like chemotaxis protein
MERRTARRPQRVLLVDDSADLRALWKLWLTFWGFAVEEARNGAEAVEKVRTYPPDLVLMDLAMPVLDGRTAMQVLASDPATAHVPVLGMSAQIPIYDRPEMDGFLPKPVEPDQLLGLIRTVLRPRSTRAVR